MSKITELCQHYYDEFRGLPSNNPIVRNNIPNDAMEIAVLDILYGKELGLTFTKDHCEELSEYIVAPPDRGIDLFVTIERGDEAFFEVIQVKNTRLTQTEARGAIEGMKRTVSDYCKNPNSVSVNCREVLSKSPLDHGSKGNCEYYVVHAGGIKDFTGSRQDEHVLTFDELLLLSSNQTEYAEEETIPVDHCAEYKDGAINSAVCSVSGYDLALLNNKYFSTKAGRNILFGGNLREALNPKKSKTYQSMEETVKTQPEMFWYLNNGITIISDELSAAEDKKSVVLRNFSIVNGAQTTSTLGAILRDAERDGDDSVIEALKNVRVLAKMLEASDDLRDEIAIKTNTQNQINTRDMVANRIEQKRLHSLLLEENPQIYVEIRRGASLPSTFNKGITHRRTTNEELAQVAFAFFLQKPHTAKDKKSNLFKNDPTHDEFLINEAYHTAFNLDPEAPEKNGILFKKTNEHIDEALFVKQLYKEARTYHKKKLVERVEIEEAKKAKHISEGNTNQVQSCQQRIEKQTQHIETVGICLFYFLSYYTELKNLVDGDNPIKYNIQEYYSNKSYREEMIAATSALFLKGTIELLAKTARDNHKQGNMNNWVRSAACQTAFLEALRDEVSTNFELEEKFRVFKEKFAI